MQASYIEENLMLFLIRYCYIYINNIYVARVHSTG